MSHDTSALNFRDAVFRLIWTSCQAKRNEDRNPPDYWFSFERSNRTPLTGEVAKDVRTSYTVRTTPPAPSFGPHLAAEKDEHTAACGRKMSLAEYAAFKRERGDL